MNFKRKLSLRYTIALSLIAIILIGTHFVRQNKTQQTKRYAYIINISGMQRMLSQRIALMAREIFHEQDEKQAKVLSVKMKDSILKMNQNLNQLASATLTDGSGLGLYLTKQNILAMGGDIHIPKDKGCEFNIQFPAQVTN